MSEEKFKTVREIDEAEIQAASIAGLRTAPNRGGTYGANGLQPQELKKKFDELPLLVKKKLHELIAAYNTLVESIANDTLGANITVRGLLLPAAIDKVASDLLGKRSDNTITTLAMLSAAIDNDPKFASSINARFEEALATAKAEIDTDIDEVSKAFSDSDTRLAEEISKKSSIRVGAEFKSDFDIAAYISAAIKDGIAEFVGEAPEALNTLTELAAALGGDANFANTVLALIGDKVSTLDFSQAIAALGNGISNLDTNKVDKITYASQVYCTNAAGNGQANITYSTAPQANTMARRQGNGALAAGPALQDTDAVPLAQMNEALATKDVEIDRLRKRIVNLEQGITPDPFYTDDSVAYVKTVPANALPYARLEAVGGMTHKVVTELPIDPSYNLFADEGNNGAVTDETIQEMFPGSVVGSTYTLVFDAGEEGGDILPVDADDYELGNPFTLVEGARLRLYAYANNGNSHTVFWNVRLVEPTVLRDTPVTALAVSGPSVLACPYPAAKSTVKYGLEITFRGDGSILLNGTAERGLSLFLYDESNGLPLPKEGVYIHRCNSSGAILYLKSGEKSYHGAGAFVPSEGDAYYGRYVVYLSVAAGSVFSQEVVLPCITEGTTERPAATYLPPYAVEIPEAVRLLSGYGKSVGGSRNELLWPAEGGVCYKRVVAPLEEDPSAWVRGENAYGVYYQVTPDVAPAIGGAVLCNKYPSRPASEGVPCIYVAGSHIIVFPGGDVKDDGTAAPWRDALAAWERNGNPFSAQYLIEPVLTDVGEYFAGDAGYIEVRGGGRITAQNENGDAAPTTIKYQLKEG